MVSIILRFGVLSACACLFVGQALAPQQAVSQEPDPKRTKVQTLLDRMSHCGLSTPAAYRALMEMGDDAFPSFELILKDPKTRPKTTCAALYVLREMKTDRRRFIEVAVAKLADTHRGVRQEAVELLAVIGSERDTPPIVTLLSDEDVGVAFSAADALSAIGGKRDLIAMDAWLKSGTAHRNDGDYLIHVKKCRDALEKRLKENPIPKDLKD